MSPQQVQFRPAAGYVYQVTTSMPSGKVNDFLVKNGLFTFFCFGLNPKGDSFEAVEVYVPEIKQGPSAYPVVLYRRRLADVRFSAKSKDMVIHEMERPGWLTVDEAEAEAELKELSESPFAHQASKVFDAAYRTYVKKFATEGGG